MELIIPNKMINNMIFENLFTQIDDLGEAKSHISEITRRYHELEIELRRLENERDELTAAYKEAEAVNIQQQHSLSMNLHYCFPIFFLSNKRVVKPKSNVHNVWPLSTTNTVTMLNAVLPKRMKKWKLFGKTLKNDHNFCGKKVFDILFRSQVANIFSMKFN